MLDFDSAAWVSRARAFTTGLRPVPAMTIRSTAVSGPATESNLQDIERAPGRTLPTPLRALFKDGTAALDCGYVFEPEGGGSACATWGPSTGCCARSWAMPGASTRKVRVLPVCGNCSLASEETAESAARSVVAIHLSCFGHTGLTSSIRQTGPPL